MYYYFLNKFIKMVHVLIAHYNEDLTWLDDLKYDYTIISRRGIKQETAPNKGNEASAFLEYIIKNYNSLDDYTVFVHGHRSSWHHVENMDEKLETLVFDREYYNLNDFKSRTIEAGSATTIFRDNIYIFEDILECGKLDVEKHMYRGCSQFYVSRNAIRRHSVDKYEKMYDWLMNTTIISFWSGRIFEYIWHYIFTGDIIDKD
jgi:hypothetical protein